MTRHDRRVHLVLSIIHIALWVFIALMWIRFVVDWVQTVSYTHLTLPTILRV